MNRKKTSSKPNSALFYVVIVLLMAGIVAMASAPYIIRKMGESSVPSVVYTKKSDQYGRPSDFEEMRGVWVAYLSLGGVNESAIDSIVSSAKANGMNTIFLHVRPFGDALYQSKYYPWSHLISGTQGVAPEGDFDPLAYAVEAAHREGLALHAWLNPLRIMLPSGVYPPSLSDAFT